jgi:hypothetical protein
MRLRFPSEASPHEVNVFEECIRRYSRVAVSSFLELVCGGSPRLPELVRHGCTYVGIDVNDAMLAYARSKLPGSEKAAFLRADMCDFRLGTKAQFAFVGLGSLFATSNDQLISHFHSVADALDVGGLHLLDWCVHFGPMESAAETWTITQGRITVNAEVQSRIVDPIRQLFEEAIELSAIDDGRPCTCTNFASLRVIYPQEFPLFIECCTDFEFVGWWNDWDLDEPLAAGSKVNRPIVLLRRR